MWRDAILALVPGARLNNGATETDLVDAERQLGFDLPPDLRRLLAETNGFMDEPGWTCLVWPLRRVVSENLHHRDPSWPFADDGPWIGRLCFADDGCGDDFFVDLNSSCLNVKVWNYIDGKSYPVAPSLAEFLTRWLSGSSDSTW